MKPYYVAICNLAEGELHLELVMADSWHQAVVNHSKYGKNWTLNPKDEDESKEYIPLDITMEDFQADAYNKDLLVTILYGKQTKAN